MVEIIKKITLIIALTSIVGTILYFEKHKPTRITPKNSEINISLTPAGDTPVRNIEEKIKKFERAKEIVNPKGFINTPPTKQGQATPVTIKELVGKKVILIDFWTYSCINCQRTLPYLTSWYEKYKEKGLEIIGIHTPEFQFEQKYENVLAATKKFEVKYPVVLDNDYATWTAYRNRYWPRKYLIDIDGFIVYDHIGEGFYDETEKKIQELLKERLVVLGIKEEMIENTAKPQDTIAVDFSKVKSPETYFGSARNEYLGNGNRFMAGMQTFTEPKNILLNKLYFTGNWNIQPEYAKNLSGENKIVFRYNAKNVYLVAGSDAEIKIKIKKDGMLIKEEIVKEEKLYNIIENSDYGEHVLEIIIENPGLRTFALTFG